MPTITTDAYLATRGKRDRARNYAREVATKLQTVADILAMPDHTRNFEDATGMMGRSFSRVFDQNALPTRDQVADALRGFTSAEDAFLVADASLTAEQRRQLGLGRYAEHDDRRRQVAFPEFSYRPVSSRGGPDHGGS
jgi:hypothetical protein